MVKLGFCEAPEHLHDEDSQDGTNVNEVSISRSYATPDFPMLSVDD